MFNKAEKILAKMKKRNEELRDKKRKEREDRGESEPEDSDAEDGAGGIEFGDDGGSDDE